MTGESIKRKRKKVDWTRSYFRKYGNIHTNNINNFAINLQDTAFNSIINLYLIMQAEYKTEATTIVDAYMYE